MLPIFDSKPIQILKQNVKQAFQPSTGGFVVIAFWTFIWPLMKDDKINKRDLYFTADMHGAFYAIVLIHFVFTRAPVILSKHY